MTEPLSHERRGQDSPAQRLEAAFRHIAATRMAGVAMLNAQLSVEAVGFRPCGSGQLGVLITPWFMNLVCLPDADAGEWAALPSGSKQDLDLPSGAYEFLTAHEDAIGPYLSSSLFSPMFQFPDQDQAREVARAVLAELFKPAMSEPGSEPEPEQARGLDAKLAAPVSRRGFLGALLPREKRS